METKTTEKKPEKRKPSDLIEFFKFRLRIKGYEGKGENKRKIIERDGNDPIKICKLLQIQADELNAHRENTLIEYKEK